MDAFLLRAPPTPWGDYGGVLVHGMSAHLPATADGHIQLERVGPFMPPVTFPAWNVVISELTRQGIVRAGLVGVTFRDVSKARIVALDWQPWDRESRLPPYVPPSGAPEDYVLDRPHDPATALAIGPVWEVSGPTVGSGTRERLSKRPRAYRTTITLPESVGADFFRVSGVRHLLVSRTARQWLEAAVGDWVDFEAVEVVA